MISIAQCGFPREVISLLQALGRRPSVANTAVARLDFGGSTDV